jgi:hypothetical protein
MDTSRSRAALDAWLDQVGEVLREHKEPDTGQDSDEEPAEHEDAA